VLFFPVPFFASGSPSPFHSFAFFCTFLGCFPFSRGFSWERKRRFFSPPPRPRSRIRFSVTSTLWFRKLPRTLAALFVFLSAFVWFFKVCPLADQEVPPTFDFRWGFPGVEAPFPHSLKFFPPPSAHTVFDRSVPQFLLFLRLSFQAPPSPKRSASTSG